jgi:CDP-diglyceride synthetase
MNKILFFIFWALCNTANAFSQCAVCKTTLASSADNKTAEGLNGGILYLAAMPLAFMLFLGYKWYKQDRETT